MSRPKEKRFATYPSRFSSGKVHRYLYDSLNKLWYVACVGTVRHGPHGRVVDPTTEVTCKKC